MFCPTCGIEARDNTKYCTKCGNDLRSMKTSETGAWPWQSWERFELEKLRQKNKITPEEKRINEMKAGVICSSVGLGVFAFLFPFFSMLSDMTGVQLLQMIPFAACVPFFIGLGLIFNGMVLGRKLVEVKKRESEEFDERFKPIDTASLISGGPRAESPQLPQGNYNSITENTTYQLRDPIGIENTEK